MKKQGRKPGIQSIKNLLNLIKKQGKKPIIYALYNALYNVLYNALQKWKISKTWQGKRGGKPSTDFRIEGFLKY